MTKGLGVSRLLPAAKGKLVVFTTYVDANLYHDLIIGRPFTGVLHLINKTPLDWYTKIQATVETATYCSEFVAARIAVDQIIDIRSTLRYFGVLMHSCAILLIVHRTVITHWAIQVAKFWVFQE